MDNAAHLHLLVNHFPIVGAFLAVPVLVLALILRKERGLLLAGTLLLVVVGVSGWYSVRTGKQAMEQIQDQEGKDWNVTFEETDAPGVHEDRAELAMWFAYPTAVISILVLAAAHVRPADNPLGRVWIGVVLVAALATSGAMAWAGNAGGTIMHREIRGDSLDTTAKPAEGHGDGGK